MRFLVARPLLDLQQFDVREEIGLLDRLGPSSN